MPPDALTSHFSLLTSPPLAALVSPALLYLGVGGAAVPILIHLLSKRRFRRIRWAAIDFLIEAERRNRRRVRIEELLLLALRCLAMGLIGLMVARWFLQPEALAAVLGSRARTHRIVLLDDSFSMALREPGSREDSSAEGNLTAREAGGIGSGSGPPSVFDRGKAAAHRLVGWLADETPDDMLTVLLTSRPDRPVASEASLGKADRSAVAEKLAGLTPSYRSANMPAAFDSLRAILGEGDAAADATVYVVSDFRRVDWTAARQRETGTTDSTDTNEAPSAHSPAARLAGQAGDERGLRIVLVDVGSATAENVCVAALEPQQAQAVAGVSTRFITRVRNYGDSAATATTLQVYVGDAAQPPATVPAIGPGQAVDVPVEVTFPHEGPEILAVELRPDALAADDTRRRAVAVERALRVLVVNGEPSPDLHEDEVSLLSVALRPAGPQFSGNELTTIDENELERTDLANFHAVVMANVFRISEDTARRLEDYVSAGGGLAIFLGDQVDADVYNRTLFRDGDGLLPGRLGEVIVSPPDQPGAPIGTLDAGHAALKRFSDLEVNYFDQVRVWAHLACTPAGAEPSDTSETPELQPVSAPPAGEDTSPDKSDTAEALIEQRPPGRVLARLDDESQSPLIVERPLGQGRVVMVTTSVDKEWNNLADRPVFVVLAMELIQHVARGETHSRSRLVGEPIDLALDPARYQPTATLQPPAYPAEPSSRVHAQPDEHTGFPVVHWPHTDQPGVYRFELVESLGSPGLELVAVNIDPRESDLRPADRVSLLASMEGLDVTYVRGENLTSGREEHARQELWPAVLVLLLAVLMLEQALAWWFGTERRWRSEK